MAWVHRWRGLLPCFFLCASAPLRGLFGSFAGEVSRETLQGSAHFRRRDFSASVFYPDRRPHFDFEKMRKGDGAFLLPQNRQGFRRSILRDVGREQKGGIEVGFHGGTGG